MDSVCSTDKSDTNRAEHWCVCVFPGECHSQTVEEWELTRCVEDVYKVRTPKGIH